LKWTVLAGQPPNMEPPKPRLCHLTKWADFQGYGFNLHTDKSKESQLVGNVDTGSPAEAAGVKKGDKIIEVNGTNISNENHTQVVGRIKAGGSETRILVADKECVEWHLEHKQTISSSLPYVVHLSSQRSASPVPSSCSSSSLSAEEEAAPRENPPAPVQPIVEEDEEEEDEVVEEEEARPSSPPPTQASAPPPAAAPAPATPPSSSSEMETEDEEETETPSPTTSPAVRAPPAGKEASSSDEEPVVRNPMTRKESTSSEEEVQPRSFGTQASKTSVTSSSSRFSYKKDELVAGLQLNMTAAEMRARVSRKKKADPRAEKMDLKQKAAMIQNM